MAPRLSGQNSIFGGAFFVSKSLLGIERQKKLEKFAILTRKPRGHARILIYRTWPNQRYSTQPSNKSPCGEADLFHFRLEKGKERDFSVSVQNSRTKYGKRGCASVLVVIKD